MGLMGAIIGLNETYNQFEKELTTKEDKIKQDIDRIFVNNKNLFIPKSNMPRDLSSQRRYSNDWTFPLVASM